mmetsp:Transcript_16997/g.48390  ORF Transcript_16997/g.48390 Transcript_16997/m.48390 type:complete len:218 (+) Transcript_16997:2570-3223(+)
MVWKRGAICAVVFAALISCCTKRPRIRSTSRSPGSKGIPALSRCRMRDICTARGSRLNSSLVFSRASCFSTSLNEGGFAFDTASVSPRISTSSCFRSSISGSDLRTCRLMRTTPDGRPRERRRSKTCCRWLTACFRDMRSSSTLPSALFSWRPSMVSIEKVHRVCSATSMVSASSPHRRKCQYFLELRASKKMLPATSPSDRRALSKPRVMGMKCGT